MLTLKSLEMLLGATLLMPFVPTPAAAQTLEQAPMRPVQGASVPAELRLLTVCPDLMLYPPVPSKPGKATPADLRPTLADYWEQDYPILIYDATTQNRYWLEPPTNEKEWRSANGNPILRRLDRVFTPTTYNIEKPIVAVCGLHFKQTSASALVSTPVLGGNPTFTNAVSAGGTAPMSQPDLIPLLDAPDLVIQSSGSSKAHAAPNPCDQLAAHYATARKDLEAFKKNYLVLRTLVASSGAVPAEDDLFSSQSLLQEIDHAYKAIDKAKRPPNGLSDLADFEYDSNAAQSQSVRLAAAVSGYNAAIANKKFSADTAAATKALAALATDSSQLQSDLAALPQSETCGDEVRPFEDKLSRWIDEATDTLQSIDSAQESFQIAQLHLVRNMRLLNRWYLDSNVSGFSVLQPASANALLQISFTVTDPPPPTLYKVVEVSEAKPAAPKPPKPTTITINKSDPKNVVITVDNGGTAAAVTVNAGTGAGVEADPSVKVQVQADYDAQPSAANNPPAAMPNVAPPGAKAPDSSSSGGASAPPPNVTVAANGKTSGTPPSGGSQAPAPAPLSQTSKSSLMERHWWGNFAITGGFLGTRFTNTTYSALTLPVSTVTTTITSTSTSAAPTVTVAGPTVANANYALATSNGPIQEAAVAGITWYPFGHDTYPVTRMHRVFGPSLSTYAEHSPIQKWGVFLGTSVSSLGTFTIGPSFDLFQGVQLYSGVVLQSRNRIAAGIIPCTGVGSSVSTTSNNNTVTSSTGVTTTQAVTTQTTSNCANTDATLLGTTTVPTNSALKPAWGFGFMLNSDLLKAFSLFGGKN